MTLRYLSGATIATALACGLTSITPAYGQDVLPREESAVITVTGCLLGADKPGRFVLAAPRLGAVANVENGACDAPIDARTLDLEDADDRGINETLIGRWVEISGRLERETSNNPSNLREMSVRSFRVVPVVPPQQVQFTPPPAAPVNLFAPPAPSAAPPTAIEDPLPTTASPLAMLGLLGLLSLAGGIGVNFYRARARG
jgi:hypothetical protein